MSFDYSRPPVPLGGSIPETADEVRRAIDAARGTQATAERKAAPSAVWVRSVEYAGPMNSSSAPPSGEKAGLELADGSRVYAEPYLVTAGTTATLKITVRASQNGVRAYVEHPSVALTGGSVRWWTFNPSDRNWYRSAAEDVLPTDTQRAATPDNLIGVGST